jgi:hypothetical protein
MFHSPFRVSLVLRIRLRTPTPISPLGYFVSRRSVASTHINGGAGGPQGNLKLGLLRSTTLKGEAHPLQYPRLPISIPHST